ncbi:hypothetical protein BGY98DRAFT_651854 [Russula aff. rugulosa BPL654]|nr:hypothetical protein BGY98DRAFT_651854 [Russula aff. rugulosa BPL654]
MLPSKTIPEVKSRKHRVSKHKTIKSTSAPAAPSRKKVRLTYSTEVEGEKGAHTGHSSASSFQVSYPVLVKIARCMKKSPIYLFYEIVPNGENGKPGDDGDVHYCCLHSRFCSCGRTNIFGLMLVKKCLHLKNARAKAAQAARPLRR